MDSEEDDDDDILMKKPLPQPVLELKNNGDERIKCNPIPDLTCTRSHSASSASNSAPAKVLQPHRVYNIILWTLIQYNRLYTDTDYCT